MDASVFRDRIIPSPKGDRVWDIHSAELSDHDGNPREHPNSQKAVMQGVLSEIGIIDTLVVYKSERAGGKYVVIDGHMRKNDFQREWPCIVVDLTDDEADLALAAHDAVGSLALTDAAALRKLRDKADFSDKAVQMALDKFEAMSDANSVEVGGGKEKKPKAENSDGPNPVPEMELRPYEHYDAILVLCRSTKDWNWLSDRLKLRKVTGHNDPRYKGKIGVERAIPADRLIRIIQSGEDAEAEVRRLRRKYGEAAPLEDTQTPAPAAARPADQPPLNESDFRNQMRGMV